MQIRDFSEFRFDMILCSVCALGPERHIRRSFYTPQRMLYVVRLIYICVAFWNDTFFCCSAIFISHLVSIGKCMLRGHSKSEREREKEREKKLLIANKAVI